MNKFLIMGRLCTDPEIRYTSDQKAVCRFRFAVNRRFKRDDEPEADFFQCVAFGKIAETFEKCSISKGTKLMIDGEVRNNNYTDNDGVKHYSDQVIVNAFEFCESKPAAASAPTEYNTPQAKTDDDGFMHVPEGIDYDLPFV